MSLTVVFSSTSLSLSLSLSLFELNIFEVYLNFFLCFRFRKRKCVGKELASGEGSLIIYNLFIYVYIIGIIYNIYICVLLCVCVCGILFLLLLSFFIDQIVYHTHTHTHRHTINYNTIHSLFFRFNSHNFQILNRRNPIDSRFSSIYHRFNSTNVTIFQHKRDLVSWS